MEGKEMTDSRIPPDIQELADIAGVEVERKMRYDLSPFYRIVGTEKWIAHGYFKTHLREYIIGKGLSLPETGQRRVG